MQLRTLTIPCLLLLSCGVYGQDYSGRWKETARIDRQNKPVTFTDTMRLAEVTKDSLKIRRGSFLYPGAIYNDLLDMTYTQYQVIRMSPSEIKLGDESYIYTFSKELPNPASSTISAGMQDAALPAAPVSRIDISLLKGEWQAYSRKKKDGSPQKINYKTLLKSASFNNNDGQLTGIVNAQSGEGTPLYTVKKTEGSHIVVSDTGNKEHLLTVWKLTKDELVIEDEDGFLYYMKQF